jgi:hypothetical protein
LLFGAGKSGTAQHAFIHTDLTGLARRSGLRRWASHNLSLGLPPICSR